MKKAILTTAALVMLVAGCATVPVTGDPAVPVYACGIAAGKFGATEETDGIEAMRGDFGPDFPGGLFVAQDGVTASGAQNFKLVPLGAIEAAFDKQMR